MSFHLYINELYCNATGTVQFVELSVGPAESFLAELPITALL